MIEKGDRSAGVLRLSLFGEEAIPDLLGEVRINNFHIDWPSPSLAALAGLKRIGIERLRNSDKDFLRSQVDLAIAQIDSLLSDPPKEEGGQATLLEKDNMRINKDSWRKDIAGRIAIVKEIVSIVGAKPQWDRKIQEAERALDSSQPLK
jgi:hypothetical protein